MLILMRGEAQFNHILSTPCRFLMCLMAVSKQAAKHITAPQWPERGTDASTTVGMGVGMTIDKHKLTMLDNA